MNRLRLVLLLSLFCLLAESVFAQQFWESAPYQQWTKEQARQLLQNSPWAQEYVLSSVQPGIHNPLGGPTQLGGSESIPKVAYQVQLRSAAPIRRAIVRMSQLTSEYDGMSSEQKKQFDLNASRFISQNFSQQLAIYISYGSNQKEWDNDLRQYWRAQTTDLLKNSIFLQCNGEKLQLLSFQNSAGDAFQLTFARPKTVSPDSTIMLEFQHPGVGFGEKRILIEFKLGNMRLNGTTEY